MVTASNDPFSRRLAERKNEKNFRQASQLDGELSSGDPFRKRAAQRKLQNNKPEDEGFWTSALRSLYQIPSAVAQLSTYPMDLFNLVATGEALDPEAIESFKREAEKSGIPFDEEAYYKAVNEIATHIPTQSNIERMVEEQTGLPLTPKTKLQKAIKLGTMAAKGTPGGWQQKAVAGVSAPAVSETLQHVGVPETVSEMVGLGAGGIAGAKAPTVGMKQKPSGLTERGFEKLTSPKEVSGKKISQIETKLENEFRDLSDKIIENSPLKKSYEEYKTNPAYDMELNESLEEVNKLAEDIKTPIHGDEIRKRLVEHAIEKEKGIGYKPGEYDKDYTKFIKEAIDEIHRKENSVSDLVTAYRKNNRELRGAFDPGRSYNYNQAKKDAILTQNRVIAEIFEEKFPGSEFSNLFRETNKNFSQYKDSQALDEFITKIFNGKINYQEATKIFSNPKLSANFKRALGSEEFKNFQQLTKDLMSTGKGYKMMKVAKEKGFTDLAKDFFAYTLHPGIGWARGAYKGAKYLGRKAWESILDKPQLAVTWNQGLQELKKGNFAKAEKHFEELKKESEAIKPSEILKAEKQQKSVPEEGMEIAGEAERITPKEISGREETKLLEAPKKQIEYKINKEIQQKSSLQQKKPEVKTKDKMIKEYDSEIKKMDEFWHNFEEEGGDVVSVSTSDLPKDVQNRIENIEKISADLINNDLDELVKLLPKNLTEKQKLKIIKKFVKNLNVYTEIPSYNQYKKNINKLKNPKHQREFIEETSLSMLSENELQKIDNLDEVARYHPEIVEKATGVLDEFLQYFGLKSKPKKEPVYGKEIGVKSEPKKEKINLKPAKALTEEKVSEIKKQDISKQGLKEQKNDLLAQIDEALSNLDKYADKEKITFDVPGDGHFKIYAHEKALKQFRKSVEKKWPTGKPSEYQAPQKTYKK